METAGNTVHAIDPMPAVPTPGSVLDRLGIALRAWRGSTILS